MKQEQVFGRLATAMPGDEQDGKVWRRHCAKIDHLSIDDLDRQQTNTTQHCDISIWMERFGED